MYRCSICDYTEEEGSFLTNREPSHKNKVRYYGDTPLCDECAGIADENLAELSEADVEVEGS